MSQQKQQPSHVGLFQKLKARKEATDKATSESIWKQGKGGSQVVAADPKDRTRPTRTLTLIY